eukprot:scpid24923/ scgid25285/ 
MEVSLASLKCSARARNPSRPAPPPAVEKMVHFLQEIGPAGWSLLNMLKLREMPSPPRSAADLELPATVADTGKPAYTFYVDDVQGPHWVACVAHEMDGLVHVTLGFAPLAPQDTVCQCLDALEAAGALNWNLKMLFPYLRCDAAAEEILKRADARGCTTSKDHLSRLYFPFTRREQATDNNGATDTQDHSYNSAACALPHGYTIDKLCDADAAIILKYWKYGANEGACHYIAGTINKRRDLTCGIYVRDSQGRGTLGPSDPAQQSECRDAADACGRELVAWGIVSSYGAIGVVHTLEGYRRRGFAQVIVRCLETAMQRHSLHAFACIEAGNDTSFRCFEKAGFGQVAEFNVLWLLSVPDEGAAPHASKKVKP